MTTQTVDNPVAEARRVCDQARVYKIPLRVMGGVAVALRCPSATRPPLARSYGDIDFATRNDARIAVETLFFDLGYRADREMNMLHGRDRLIFFDDSHRRQVDVIVDELRMCHTIDLRARLEHDDVTLTLADLLLSKLQVVETTEKDYLDISALLSDHRLGSGDGDVIDIDYIASLCAGDWGLYRTITQVAQRSAEAATAFGAGAGGYPVREQVDDLLEAIEREPKSMRWRARAKVGEHKRWYAEPDEGKTTLWDS